TPPAPPSISLCPPRFLGRLLRLLVLRRSLDPPGLDASGEDHRLGLLARDVETGQKTFVLDRLAIFLLAPAHEVVRHAAGEILERLHVVLAELHQYLR